MAKGKKQKPKKRVARRVEDELQGTEGTDEGLDEGADEGTDDSADEGGVDESTEDTSEAVESVEPVAARAAEPKRASQKHESETTRLSDGKRGDKSSGLPTEMPVTQTSEKGPVIFLGVIFGLLGLAIAVGFLTN